ncbi:MAG: DUF1002 domain-containing protein [Firmicutes bacterium]|nr:DUF1002 domain-containing protein [Bacillota bacterium]
MRRVLTVFLMVIIFTSMTGLALAQNNFVVSLGADLTKNQRTQMLNLFKTDENSAKIIEVTNQEERTYLEGLISDKQIGTRAISSAFVEVLSAGEGIMVETYNINWVTKEMYANAMVTAGLENAKVVAAAPFEVSGTAALTGIMKAFELATGEKLSEDAKKTANEELVTTGELGQDVGQDKAAALVKEIKERIIKEKITDPEDIRRIIIEIAADLNITITQKNIDQLADLMERISKLDLNVDKVTSQLEKITGRLDDVKRTLEANKGLLQQILDAIKRFFEWLSGILR